MKFNFSKTSAVLFGLLLTFVCGWYLFAKITSAPLAVYSFSENKAVATIYKNSGLKVATYNTELSADGENAMVLFAEKGFVSYLPEKPGAAAYTFPSAKPDRLIDWIIGKGIRSFSGAKNIPSDLSDHLMIAAEVDLGEQI